LKSLRNKRILVTGAAGFIGTNLILKLSELGAVVTGTLHNNLPQHELRNVKLIKCDLTRVEDCLEVTKEIDYVFMAAANSSGAEVIEKSPLNHLTPNIIMNTRMLEAAYANGVKEFCFISSNTVYPVTNFPVRETDTDGSYFSKYFIVGNMKRFCEQMCEMYAQFINKPMKTLVIRPGNIYGPFDKFGVKESKVVASLVRKAVEGKFPLEVWGDGQEVKDFIYIDDFIEGLISAFLSYESFEIYNIASGKQATVADVAKRIIQICETEITNISYKEGMPSMIPTRLIDISKIKNDTGWEPSVSLKEGLEKTIDWYSKVGIRSSCES